MLVYTAFFAVQLIYNFDVSTTSTTALSLQQSTFKNVSAFHGASTYSRKRERKNIWLNKRFQPENIPVCDVVYQNPILFYSDEHSYSLYNGPFLSLHERLAHTLRGPPLSYIL
ncbi:MAG: hypothetical protein KGO81_02740 [Bacteroidota bacterium]|nr:hypothetical protein [Bacteroidota bacterium]